MALKRVVQLTEGPLDFVRGAVKQVAPAVRNVAQAGRQTSAVADLTKAVTALVQLLQAESQQKANTPAPQYQQAGRPAQPTGTTPQMSARPQMTFASYMQDVEGDRLDEGAWDAIKSGASAVARGIGGAARAAIDPDGPIAKSFRSKFANDPWLTDAAKAAAAHRRPPATVQQQKQYQLQQIQKILQRTQNPQQALKKVLGQVAGSGTVANQIYAMIFPSNRTAQQPAQPSVRTNTQWQQGQQPAPRQQPARTFGPGKRRQRPTGTQP